MKINYGFDQCVLAVFRGLIIATVCLKYYLLNIYYSNIIKNLTIYNKLVECASKQHFNFPKSCLEKETCSQRRKYDKNRKNM